MQILHRFTSAVLFEHDTATKKELLEKAVERGANLSGANLLGANLLGANLRGATLLGAKVRGAKVRGAKVPDLDGKILHALETGGSLQMDAWHKCETTHCRAGWAITVCPKGKALEETMGTETAATLIYVSSYPDLPVPNFFATESDTLNDIKARAALAKMKPPNKINKKVTNEDREKTLGKSTAALAEKCLTHLQQGVPYSTKSHQ